MHSQFDFDSTLDSESLNTDRNVLNKSDSSVEGLIFHSGGSALKKNQTSVSDGGISSIEFTDSSSTFYEPLEDMDLLTGKTKPTVVGTGISEPVDYSAEHKIYDPSVDATTGIGHIDFDSTNRKTDHKFTKESFGLPNFYTNPVDLIIASLILILVIVIEIIGLVAIL